MPAQSQDPAKPPLQAEKLTSWLPTTKPNSMAKRRGVRKLWRIIFKFHYLSEVYNTTNNEQYDTTGIKITWNKNLWTFPQRLASIQKVTKLEIS